MACWPERVQVEVLLLLLLLLALGWLSQSAAAPVVESYYCLDYFKEMGKQLAAPAVPREQQITAGQTARWCNAQCDAWGHECTAAWSAGAASTEGPACKLLHHTAADVQEAATDIPGRSYPNMQPEFRARDGIQNRTLSYMCFKNEQDWDTVGSVLHSMAMKGQPDGAGWCANSHDVAGYNIARFSNTTSVYDCVQRCRHTQDCTLVTFLLTTVPNTNEPSGYDCWIKTAAMQQGENGWTAAYQNDSYASADTVITCFNNLEDWRKYGLRLSPTLATMDYNGLVFTVFPERVNFSEARAACAELPNGSLAILPSRQDVLSVGQQMLPMLPWQRSLQTAWVGVMGNNSRPGNSSNPTEPMQDNGSDGPDGFRQPQLAFITNSLHWLDKNKTRMQPASLKQLRQRPFSWMWHDNVYSYQTRIDAHAKYVCGALTNQWPPFDLPPAPGDNEPGIYYFDCNYRPAAFICQSTNITAEFLQGQQGRISSNERYKISVQREWNMVRRLVIAIAVPLVVVALLCGLLLACQCSRHIDRVTNMLYYQRKRAQGKPTNGQLSVVVTDIQGFTHLTEAEPDAMAKALALHNQIIRKCCHEYAGCVLQLEGDAFVIAFHEPLDAVAFALQVQQALLHANMPAEIRYEDEWEGSNCCQLAAKSTLNSTYSPPPAVSAKSAPASWRPPSFCVKQSSTSEDPPLALADAAAALAFGVGASGAAGKAERVKSAFTAAAVQASIQEEEGASPQRDRAAAGEAPGKGRGLLRLLSTFSSTSSCNGAAANPPALTKQGSGTAAGLAQRLRSLCGGGSNISDACGISSLPTPTALSADASSASGTGCSRVSGRVTNSSAGLVGQWWKQLLFQGGSSVGQQLFKGLRVRIGIASGSIRRGQDIETTLAYSKARVVSDVANGGQILMDAATFAAIRNNLHRLGRVGPDGMDYQQLKKRKEWRLLKALRVARSPPPDSSKAPNPAKDAVVLDMGLYETSCVLRQLSEQQSVHSRMQQQPSHQQPHHTVLEVAGADEDSEVAACSDHFAVERSQQPLQLNGRSSLSCHLRQTLQRLSHLSQVSRLGSLSLRSSASRITSGGLHSSYDSCKNDGVDGIAAADSGSFRRSEAVKLYQVLPPGLAGRAALFGNTLCMPEGWKCLDQPYFAAPGLCDVLDLDGQVQQQQQQQGLVRLDPAATFAGASSSSNSHLQVASSSALAAAAAGPRAVGSATGAVGTAFGGSTAAHTGSMGGSPLSSSSVEAQSSSSGVASQQQLQQQRRRLQLASSTTSSRGQSLAALRAASLHCSWHQGAAGMLSMSAEVMQGLGLGPSSGPGFSAVTAVFVGVEGSQQLLLHQYPGLRQMHTMLHRLMLHVLCLVPGGYMVRAQEGELRYVLTFTSPSAAIEWCLVVQEAALYLPYSQNLLQYRGLRVQHDSASGRLVFRGPRLKMGLAEGVPKGIVPDNCGRADYFGPFMNQAARFCDAAGHGGQVVSDAALAKKVLQLWQRGSCTRHSSSGSSSGSGVAGAGMPGSDGPNAAPSGFDLVTASCFAHPAAAGTTPRFGAHADDGTAAEEAAEEAAGEAAAASAAAYGSAVVVAAAEAPATPQAVTAGSRQVSFADAAQEQPESTCNSPATAGQAVAEADTVQAADAACETAVATTDSTSSSSRRAYLAQNSFSRDALPVLLPVSVEVSWLGTFAFKGTSRSVNMVNFTPSCLCGRNFPPDAPRGKGARISQRQGLMGKQEVMLPSSLAGSSLFT